MEKTAKKKNSKTKKSGEKIKKYDKELVRGERGMKRKQ